MPGPEALSAGCESVGNACSTGANLKRVNEREHTPPTRVRRASLTDVAKAAGVSVTTASRVFSKSTHSVSSSTRQKVEAAAARLDFEPNRIARGLVTSRSQIIGVIVHDISDPYFGEVVRALEDRLGRDDYQLLVVSSDREPDKELTYLKALIGQRVDGIVLAASSITNSEYELSVSETIARYRRQGGAVVLLSEHIVSAPRIRFDNRGSAREMVSHLIRLGHRRIAHLRGHLDLATSNVRLDGYRDALKDAGITVDEALVVDGHYTIEGGRAAAVELLRRTDYTALFASNDLMAIGACRGLIDAGVGIPDQVSVAGFDDIVLAEYGPVPLTTFEVPIAEMGRLGAELMLSLLKGGRPPSTSVEGRIVERASIRSI